MLDASPALFVPNQGQFANASTRYAFEGMGADISFTNRGLTFQVDQAPTAGSASSGTGRRGAQAPKSEQFSVSFVNAKAVSPVGLEKSPTVYNYFHGNWTPFITGVPTFNEVGYNAIYPGINLVVGGSSSSLTYELDVGRGPTTSR